MPLPLGALGKRPPAEFTRKALLSVHGSPTVSKPHQICEEEAEQALPAGGGRGKPAFRRPPCLPSLPGHTTCESKFQIPCPFSHRLFTRGHFWSGSQGPSLVPRPHASPSPPPAASVANNLGHSHGVSAGSLSDLPARDGLVVPHRLALFIFYLTQVCSLKRT